MLKLIVSMVKFAIISLTFFLFGCGYLESKKVARKYLGTYSGKVDCEEIDFDLLVDNQVVFRVNRLNAIDTIVGRWSAFVDEGEYILEFQMLNRFEPFQHIPGEIHLQKGLNLSKQIVLASDCIFVRKDK